MLNYSTIRFRVRPDWRFSPRPKRRNPYDLINPVLMHKNRHIMTTKEEVFKQIQQLLVQTFELEETLVSPEAHIYNDLDLDSFDAIDLAVNMGAETGIKLQEDDLRSIRTVSDIVEIVHQQVNT